MDTYRHIVCAIDLSEASRVPCARAAALSDCCKARLTLLHVVEHFPEDRSNQIIAPEDVDPREYREREARRGLDELARTLSLGDVGREVRFTTQSAWHEVVRFAEKEQADLVVLGAREHHGTKVLFPSTTEGVSTRRVCDVLLVPAPEGSRG